MEKHSVYRRKEYSFYWILMQKSNQECWLEKFLLEGKRKSYKKLLVGKRSKVRVDKVPTKEEYDDAPQDENDLNKKIVLLLNLNELAYEDLILSINISSTVGKVAFGFVWCAKIQNVWRVASK